MIERKNHYYISDCHFGIPDTASIEKEKMLVAFLDTIKYNAKALYLLGDIFDFWFEYKYVVPKGYIRLLGKLAELSDLGIEIHYFTGNHDMWAFSYFKKELSCIMHKKPESFLINGKKFFIGHGDGLGPGDYKYKFLKKVFTCKFNQRLFALIHPTITFSVANFFSRKSRLAHDVSDTVYTGDDKEYLVVFINDVLKKNYFDYFIFGHRHLLIDMPIQNSRYINLGEWKSNPCYAVFDGEKVSVCLLNKQE